MKMSVMNFVDNTNNQTLEWFFLNYGFNAGKLTYLVYTTCIKKSTKTIKYN